MTQIVPVILLFGGSAIAHKMRIAMGYRSRNEVHTLALPLSPIRQILTSRHWNWKTPVRLARNLLWSRAGLRTPKGWSAQRIDPIELLRSPAPWPVEADCGLLLERDPELFQYLAACPLAGGAFFLAIRDSKVAGYFCLTFPPGQARIADMWTVSADVDDWAHTYALAVQQASRHPGANEITAAATSKVALTALERCGFHTRGVDPVQLFDPRGQVPANLPIGVQLIDGDAAFLSSADPNYLT
jgi:hypothetical protein